MTTDRRLFGTIHVDTRSAEIVALRVLLDPVRLAGLTGEA